MTLNPEILIPRLDPMNSWVRNHVTMQEFDQKGFRIIFKSPPIRKIITYLESTTWCFSILCVVCYAIHENDGCVNNFAPFSNFINKNKTGRCVYALYQTRNPMELVPLRGSRHPTLEESASHHASLGQDFVI